MAPVNCRSMVSEHCYAGRDETQIYEDGVQSDDGTWNGHSVICDACYIALGQPLRGTIRFITGKPS